MNETLKVLDSKGVEYLWSKISMQDYLNNETLISVINAIDETKADKSEIPFIDDTLALESAAADAKAVSDALSTKITSPTTATVGQTIVVTEVDEDGKPVSWECADVGGGCTFHATATLDGTVTQVSISEDANGNPMSLDECWILTKYTNKTSYLFTYINDKKVSYRHGIDVNAYPIYETQYYTRFGDSVYGIVAISTVQEVSGMNHVVKASGIAKDVLGGKKIEKIYIASAYGDSNLFPEGTTIEIFGR